MSTDPQPLPSTRIASTQTVTPLTAAEIAQKPWRYIGYKGYSEFISSDNDIFVIRRFACLNTRVALAFQDQLSVLEQQLRDFDSQYSRREAENLNNGSLRVDQKDRMELVEKISERLMKYIAIANAEQQYLKYNHDLIPVVPKEKSPMRRLLDHSPRFRLHPFWKVNPPSQLPLYEQDSILYTSDKRIEGFISVLIIGVGTIMLVAPIWILKELQNPNQKLAVITIFIVVFLGMISYATVAKPLESLAAAAAYSAVLMVFLQLGSLNS